jgi:hypothetical protein
MTYYDKSIYNESSFLNPGPAPRPPTQQNRSQLNVSTALQNSPSALSSPSSYVSSTNLIAAGGNGMAQNGGGSFIGDRPIRKGWASIKEDGIKSLIWQKKFMILREVSLDFHKNEQATTTSLSVPLKDIVSVNRVELKPYCIEIVRSANGTVTTISPDAPRRTIYISLKSDPELYAWMDDVYSRCPSMGGVSNPTNFTHQVHVGFDPVSGGFTGLPDEWSKLLNSSAITKEDYQKNPQAVIEVLEFYTEGQQRLQNPNAYPGMAPTPPPVYSTLPTNNGLQRQDTRDQWERERKQEKYREEERQREKEKEDMERRQREQQERRERERRERQEEEDLFNRRQQEEDDMPQKTTMAQQPLMMGGGGGGFSSSSARNPMASKSSANKIPVKAPTGRDMNPQRTAPRAPGQTQPKTSPATSNLRVAPSKPELKREPSPAARQLQQKPAPSNTVKPLNVPNKTPAKEVQAREQRKDKNRISNMTEAQVMERLRSVVSSGDPNQSYTKLKKVGQGASGSVYVAKINAQPSSAMALSILNSGKGNQRVAIKQMDLAHQPRKELIVNEILVMKESQHPNIVNFLDAFLKGNTELWVVMEYMEGGALTDVIDNNTLEEDQIATICFEVRTFLTRVREQYLTILCRLAKVLNISMLRTSFTETLNPTMCSLMLQDMSKLV